MRKKAEIFLDGQSIESPDYMIASVGNTRINKIIRIPRILRKDPTYKIGISKMMPTYLKMSHTIVNPRTYDNPYIV